MKKLNALSQFKAFYYLDFIIFDLLFIPIKNGPAIFILYERLQDGHESFYGISINDAGGFSDYFNLKDIRENKT
jgi:hypothetical protein